MCQTRHRAERAIEADRRDANQDGWDAELGSSSGSSAGRGSERQRRLRCPARRGVGAACTAWVAGSTELPDPPKASGCPGPHVYPAPSVWHEARAAAGSAASLGRHLSTAGYDRRGKIRELALGRLGAAFYLSRVSLAWRPHKKREHRHPRPGAWGVVQAHLCMRLGSIVSASSPSAGPPGPAAST